MPHFPLFVDLKERLVLIVGDTPEGRRKAEALAPFSPKIRFLEDLTPADLSPAPALVILTAGDRQAAAKLCRERSIPVNSADDPGNCTFFFPSLICRGDVTLGISSGGAAPGASKALRNRIERALPDGLEAILPWLSEVPLLLRQQIPDYDRRAAVIAAICAECFEKNRPLTGDELEQYM